VSQDTDGYGARTSASDIDRLIEDCRTLSPSGVERIAAAWRRDAAGGGVDHDAWHHAERAALHVLELTNRARQWDELRNRILDLTEHHDALVAWRAEHGDVAHRAEDALMGAALALLARPDLDAADEQTLLRPLSGTLPWLTVTGSRP
jgi:hypothetical protein